jgi:hypothetical protein
MAAGNTVIRGGMDVGALDQQFSRADIEFHGVDHSGVSYEGRVFLNNAAADETTELTLENGYAGSFHIFGHGGCFGELGHCDVRPRRLFDPRPDHPLVPARKVVIATAALRRALTQEGGLSVSVVPIIRSVTVKTGTPEDVVWFERVKIVTYR